MKSRPAMILISVVILVAVVWLVVRDRSAAPGELSSDQIGRFYTGVSSLDVEENERAHRLFGELVTELPSEPAVWANLGLAGLRLGDLQQAARALEQAARLSPENPHILELQATLDERQGRFARAIAGLRKHPAPGAAALYQLSELLGRTGRDEDAVEQLRVLNRINDMEPDNLVIAFKRARLFAASGDGAALSGLVERLAPREDSPDPAVVRYYEAVKQAVADQNFRAAGTQLVFLQNLTLPTPAYKADLQTLGAAGGSVGQPIRRFLEYSEPAAALADADSGLRFEVVAVSTNAPPVLFLGVVLGAEPGASLLTVLDDGISVGDRQTLAFQVSSNGHGTASLRPFDMNGDQRQDLAVVGTAGLKLWLQGEDGRFAEYTPAEEIRSEFESPCTGVWSFDHENDGDLDLLLARDGTSPVLLRNNGDSGFSALDAFASFPAVVDVHWSDFDGDGDGDLVLLDTDNRVMISWNHRAGSFALPEAITESSNTVALAIGDLDANGRMQWIALEQSGSVRSFMFDPSNRRWLDQSLTVWEGSPDLSDAFGRRRVSINVADLDNNGGVDIVCSANTDSAIWLNQGRGGFEFLQSAPEIFVTSINDANGDGLLDLVGFNEDAGWVAYGKGTREYGWQTIRTRALADIADGRNNSFGIGGRIEIRSGQLVSMAPITSPRTHFGLGQQGEPGVARIVWPNGVAQVEFDLAPNQEITAIQRLKGSCPWVFTETNGKFQFLKDFIWRSPLGMRINSQDTAGVDQTEDWILIPGNKLTAGPDGYEIRVTAELWETHFFDQVSLLAIDHPNTFSVHVDERFVPTRQPKLEVIATTETRPFARARDEGGRDLGDLLPEEDGHDVAGFALGRFQGIAEDHWIEFELPENAPADAPLVLIGSGWIYPTDSSLNVAVSQGTHPRPYGLILEVCNPQGEWRAVSDDLGFPAGKNKTVVIPLPRASLEAGTRHFRLRTNLEIYWDRLGWAIALPNAELTMSPATTHVADLGHRGFSKLTPLDRRKPDLPIYEELSGTGPVWRDLEGYYTRHGDVRELLASSDDRYVIMNAGDELVFRFDVPAGPPAGWARDFVLVGDGWVKDGDFNTVNSRTVHPLPSHGMKEYGGHGPLTEDPVFRRNIEDWERFHTRYANPSAFERGLMNGAGPTRSSKEDSP